MDKKDLKGMVILFTKIYFSMAIVLGVIGGAINSLIYSLSNGGNFFENFFSNFGSLLVAFLYLTSIIYGGIAAAYFMLKFRRRFETLKSNEYVRELPKYFPPAIASYLLDLSLETKDYTATIAYLISKGYIILEEGNVTLLKDSILELSQHERFVLRAVNKEVKFDYSEFVKYVIADAERMGYIKKGARKTNFWRNLLVVLSTSMISMIMSECVEIPFIKGIFQIIGFASGIGIYVVIGYSIYLLKKFEKESYHRTDLGKKEAIKWSGVKKYIRDYTMLSERDIQDVALFDDYIPYAISLNEAKNIEKYIENNEQFRKLIYGNVYNFLDK